MNRWVWLMSICIQAASAYYHELSMKPITNTNLATDSYFGFSITYQAATRSLIIGAPKASFVGLVFVYQVDTEAVTLLDTPQILLDTLKQHRAFASSYQHLYGASVKAGSNFLVTCAPTSYALFESNPKHMFEASKLGGHCFKTPINGTTRLLYNDKLSRAREWKPLGWSVDITKTNAILIGPLRMYNGIVRVVQDNTYHDLTQKEIDSLFGYSVASGNYFDDNITNLYYAVGSPESLNRYGKVLFFKANNREQEQMYTIYDNNVRSFFGASLCTVNLDDRLDYLLVGAPLYADNIVDHGAIYLYVFKNKEINRYKTIVSPSETTAYFGMSLVNLGDIDGDMKHEVAVGAPREDEGRGAVYIYSGAGLRDPNQNGNQMVIQRIQPAANTGIRSFGYSLTPLQDYDYNGCNELAVGAPKNNFVVLYKCFAYITIKLQVNAITNIQPQENQEYNKFIFQSCVNVIFPKVPENIDEKIRVQVKLLHQDVWFQTNASLGDGSTIKSNIYVYDVSITIENDTYCKYIDVSIRSAGNFEELMPYEVNASLINDARYISEFNSSRVLLSRESILVLFGQESLEDCEDRIYQPDLYMEFKSMMSSVIQLQFKKSIVPIWVIILASITVLLLLLLLGYLLFVPGLLKRKNKVKLVELKKKVYRLSKQNLLLRHSSREDETESEPSKEKLTDDTA